MPAEVEVAAVVPMPAVAPEAGVHVPDPQVTVQVNVTAMDVDPVRKMNPAGPVDPVPVDPVGSMHAVRNVGAMHARTATADAVMAAALRTRISSTGRESCNADNGRRDESEKSRLFEHGRRPFGSMWAIRILVEASTPPVQAIDFQCVFVHLTFIDGAAVWQRGDSARIAIVCGPA